MLLCMKITWCYMDTVSYMFKFIKGKILPKMELVCLWLLSKFWNQSLQTITTQSKGDLQSWSTFNEGMSSYIHYMVSGCYIRTPRYFKVHKSFLLKNYFPKYVLFWPSSKSLFTKGKNLSGFYTLEIPMLHGHHSQKLQPFLTTTQKQ